LNRNLVHIGVLGLAMLLGAGTLVGYARERADDTKNAGQTSDSLAVVDMERLYEVASGPVQLEQKDLELSAAIEQRLDKLGGVAYLDQKDLQEYITLIGKQNPADAEQAQIRTLETRSGQSADELQKLQSLPDAQVTPENKARMRELNNRQQFLSQRMPSIRLAFLSQKNAILEAYRRDQLAALRAEVAKAAKEKGVAHVFDVTAMVYSATDLTPAVMQRLNKRANR
jgi:Skp family chaperone for outer membrane proteins